MYTSPLHILDAFTEQGQVIQPDKAALIRIRKQVLAEFDLQQTTTITLNKKAYTKDEIIKGIDQLLNLDQLATHLFIYNDKQLLKFLEDEKAETIHPSLAALHIPEAIQQDVSGLILEKLVHILKSLFNKRKFGNASAVFAVYNKLSEEDAITFLDQVYRSLFSLSEQIDHCCEGEIESMPDAFDFLARKAVLPTFLNKLPEQLHDIRDKVVVSIINCMVRYQQESNKDKNYLFHVSEMLMTVDCNEENSSLIASNHKSFSSQSGKFSSENSRTIYIVSIVIVFLLRITFTCNTHTGGPNYSSVSTYHNNAYLNDILLAGETNADGTPNDLKNYRLQLISSADHKENTSDTTRFEQIDWKGKTGSPFRMLFFQKEIMSFTDSTSTKLPVKNKTGFDLIAIIHNEANVRARYLSNNALDTFILKSSDRMFLYFGDSLRALKNLTMTDREHLSPAKKDVFFGYTTEATRVLFYFDYVLQLKKWGAGVKLPQLVLKPKIFRGDSINSSRMKFYPVMAK